MDPAIIGRATEVAAFDDFVSETLHSFQDFLGEESRNVLATPSHGSDLLRTISVPSLTHPLQPTKHIPALLSHFHLLEVRFSRVRFHSRAHPFICVYCRVLMWTQLRTCNG
jgi:hypothetical protein